LISKDKQEFTETMEKVVSLKCLLKKTELSLQLNNTSFFNDKKIKAFRWTNLVRQPPQCNL